MQALFPCVPLAEADHHRLHVLGRPALLHQEVDHALRLDHQVAAEEEDAEDDGEREHAEHGDLDHARHKEFALVLRENQRVVAAAVRRHHAVGVVAEAVSAVEQQRALGHVEPRGDVHASGAGLAVEEGTHLAGTRSPGTKSGLRATLCVM